MGAAISSHWHARALQPVATPDVPQREAGGPRRMHAEYARGLAARKHAANSLPPTNCVFATTRCLPIPTRTFTESTGAPGRTRTCDPRLEHRIAAAPGHSPARLHTVPWI